MEIVAKNENFSRRKTQLEIFETTLQARIAGWGIIFAKIWIFW